LFDYSKGQYSAITKSLVNYVWLGSDLVESDGTNYIGNVRSVIVALSGFSFAGAGKLIGPDG
jgi:hypothetical protein